MIQLCAIIGWGVTAYEWADDMGAYSSGSFPHQNTSERLRRLSEEVRRIAADLSRMSLEETSEESSSQDEPGFARDTVRQILRARRLRECYFDAELFSDPAWDILLELAQAEICQQRVTVSSLCIAASIPSTTGMRWVAAMTDQGLLRRNPDPLDRRRMFIELTSKAREAMRRYFAHIERTGEPSES